MDTRLYAHTQKSFFSLSLSLSQNIHMYVCGMKCVESDKMYIEKVKRKIRCLMVYLFARHFDFNLFLNTKIFY